MTRNSDTSDSATQHSTVDFDKRWLYVTGLAGITMTMAAVNATQEPGLLTITIAVGLVAVFLLIVRALPKEAISNVQ